MDSKKSVIKIISILIIISFAYTLVYIIDTNTIKKYKTENAIYSNENAIIAIDEINKESLGLNIRGWIVIKGQSESYINRSFILQDENGEVYKINSEKKERKDVTEYINDGINYDNSGLEGKSFMLAKGDKIDYKVGVLIIDKDGKERIVMSEYVINKET